MFVSDTGVLCSLVTVSGQEAAPNPGGTSAMMFLSFFFALDSFEINLIQSLGFIS